MNTKDTTTYNVVRLEAVRRTDVPGHVETTIRPHDGMMEPGWSYVSPGGRKRTRTAQHA